MLRAKEGPIGYAFVVRLDQGPILLSGGFGTELQRRGCDTRLPLWAAAALLDAPDKVRGLHADYLRAGAQILTANTFRTDPRTVALSRRDVDAAELTKTAVRLARRAITEVAPTQEAWVAGSVGPLGDCYRPSRVPDDATLREEHGQRIAALAEAGADFVLVETMNTVRETTTVLGLTRGLLPAAVAFVCGPGGRLLSGETIESAAAAVEPYGPLAILVNCCAPDVATAALAKLRGATERPFGAYANGEGCPDALAGWLFAGGTPDDAYLEEAEKWRDMGATWIGGCCGTSPRTIERLATLLKPGAALA